MSKELIVLVPLKKTLTLYFARVHLLLIEAFDAWYHKSGSFYEHSCGCVWLSIGFLLGFAFLKELYWLVIVLQDFVNVIISFERNSGIEHTYLAQWIKMWIM